jgi:hypothetical protein
MTTSETISMKKSTIEIGKKSFPSVSIILPVNNKYPHYKEDEEKMKFLLKETEKRLLRDFPGKKIKPLVKDMYALSEKIDYKKLSRGLAFYISPYREKIIHLPFDVKEKVIIDNTFEVRDLLFAAKNSFAYAVITISEKEVRVFSGYYHRLSEIKIAEMPYAIKDAGGEGHSRTQSFTSFSSVRNSSDEKSHLENQMEKYLREIDRVISKEESLKNIPLVICGTDRIAGHFKSISKNSKHIIGFVHGNFDNASSTEIADKVNPLLMKQIESGQSEMLAKLEEAMNKKKVVSGIKDVWSAAYNKRGRLLVVEKDFSVQAKTARKPDLLITKDVKENDYHFISDAVDDVIEMVLKYGGDVAFVDNGKLETHSKIALITYY